MRIVQLNELDDYALGLGKILLSGLAAANNLDLANRQLAEKDKQLTELNTKFEDVEKMVKKMEKRYTTQINRLKRAQGEK